MTQIGRWVALAVMALVSMLSFTVLASQDDIAQRRYRQATLLEQSGDTREASRMYQELHERYPQNDNYFRGVVRTLLALGQEKSLVPLAVNKLNQKADVSTAILLGSLYWKSGNRSQADSVWNVALDIGKRSAEVYAATAEAQSSVLASKQAITSYENARRLHGDPTRYSWELGGLYMSDGQTDRAVRELLSYGLTSGNITQTMGRLSAITALDGGAAIVEKELIASGETPTMLRLLLWFYREQGMHKRAIDIVRRLDILSKSKGQEIVLFADGLRKDGVFDLAIQAYKEVINEYQDDRITLSAVYGLARTLHIQKASKTLMNQEESKPIRDMYQDIVRRFPNHPIAAEALFFIGMIELEVDNNTDAALSTLQQCVNSYKGTKSAADAILAISHIHIRAQRLTEAEEGLNRLTRNYSSVNQQQSDEAAYMIAEIHLIKRNKSKALEVFRDLAARAESGPSAKALDRILVIRLFDDDSVSFDKYIDAGYMIYQNRRDSAAHIYQSIGEVVQDADLADRMNYMAAALYIELSHLEKAFTLLEKIVVRIPGSIYGDRALLALAGIQEAQGSIDFAITTLNLLMETYPRSIYLGEARERIRRLKSGT